MFTYILIFLAFVFFSASLILGIKWRKETNNLIKEISKSKQNICMGLLLLCIGFAFISNTNEEIIKLILSLIIIALGSFNTVQGIRMHQHYSKQLTPRSNR